MRQLSGTDSLMLHSDRPHAQNLIAPLGIYDPSTAPGGEVSFDDVLRFIESRLDISDSFRDRLVGVPLDLDRPWWVRDADFDLEYHVRQIALPKRGDWPQFCSQIARLGARPLDLARPPWELYIIEGLDGIDDVPAGSFAMMLKLHHAAVDGVSGAEMVTALHDSARDATRATTPSSWQPEPVPSNLALLGQAWLHSVTRPLAFLGQVVPQLRSVPGAIRQAGARPGGGAVVTATRFNRPVSPHRVWGATRLTLADMKQVRAAVPDAKVNDVALALVGGALRAYLDDKGELPEESLVAIMPISVRPTMTQRRGAPEVEAAAGGNRFGMANVAMFTQLDDPIERVRAIREATASAKSTGAMGAASLVQISELLPVLERLVARSDVVHHNMRVKASARLGLDEAGVRAVRPDAVFSHSTAYGRDGERADWPGYDSVFQAMSGWNVELAGEGNPPLFNHLGNLDMMNGTLSALATLLALYHRQRTGEANATHAALLSTATLASSETLLVVDTGAVAPYPRLDGSQAGIGDGYRIHQASDGWIAVVALDDERRAALRAVAGVDADDALAEALAGRPAAELVDALDQRGVPAEVVREQQWRTVWDDEENLRTKLVVSYPQADWGEMRQFGAYWDFGDLELQLDRACPSIGQHSAEILAELGFDADEVARLAASGAVKGPDLTASR